jgi:tRNA threonylcarbamoyladenosine biosynthesis protein TsaE
MTQRIALPDSAAAEAFGARLAAALPAPETAGPGLMLYLQGDLGAGKTTLARAMLRALGVTGTVRSPTYTLVERYRLADGECLHLDLYRIAEPGELEFLGLDEFGDCRLCLVEWPERAAGALPTADLLLRLELAGSGRELSLEPGSRRGAEWLAGLGNGD